MSTSLQVSSNFQPILDSALKEYKKKTGKELITHSLAEEITSCDSPEAILAVLQGKANELNQSQSSDERLTKWLTPTVNVLNTLSVTLGEGVGTVFPPSKIVFSAISILLVAARDTAMSRDLLIELFDRIEDFFVRLRTYAEVPPSAEVTKVMGKVMAEVLSMLAIATKEMKQGRTKTFLKKLVGRTDVEDALQKLDKLEQGELRTVIAQVLKATSDIKGGVKRIEVIAQQIGTDIGVRDSGEQLLRDLRRWLSPPDPSTNHDIMCNAQHESTAAWVFNEDVFKKWESSGSLLCVHGKAGSGKSVLCSAIIQHVVTLCDAGSASMAYFYFDFRDVDKKHRRNLIPSLLIQLSSRSESRFNILSRLYSDYGNGRERPNERALVRCLNEMLMAPSLSQLLTYIVLDALDECPNTSGIPTPRGQVLELVKDLVDLRLPNLRICVTSRPEIDIRTALEPLTSDHFSLHDQPGQQRDITGYISSVVQSDPQMTRWREDDRKLVVEKLSEKADGMFRWVFCQLEVLRHCLAPSLRRQLNELPKSLDETYERVLKEIESTNQGHHARRLLRCLAVAMRPLRVEELAEVLAFDLDARIPILHAEWRWEDQEQAVLSACSSLVSIVDSRVYGQDCRVVQFSHFSVKEYLTSNRLPTARDVSQYHIVLEPAHLILARVCVGALLRRNYTTEWEEKSDVGSVNMRREEGIKDIPLFMYAAKHWTSHAQVGSVSSRLEGAMEALFDVDGPYFWAWIQIYDDVDPEEIWGEMQPLYYSALCGFYDIVQYLITEHPEQVNDYCGYIHWHTPLVAALSGRHLRVAELLVKHGACFNIRGDPSLLRIFNSPDDARVGAVQFLLEHGAWVNAAYEDLWTPMHMAAEMGLPEIAQMLFEHGADADIRDNHGGAPLHRVSVRVMNEAEGRRTILARLLVMNGADVNARDTEGMTPLHCASQHGQPEIAQLLLDHGANAHAEDVQGRNPLHEVSRRRLGFSNLPEYTRRGSLLIDAYHPREALNVAQLLLKHGVDVDSIDKDHVTPLHLASSYGMLEMARLLLYHGANANAENVSGQTPLHLVSQSEDFSRENPDVARLFLELGMNVNKQDKTQATPLHFACSHGNFNTALVLLDHGAEVNAQNADGQTPLHPTSHNSNIIFGDETPRVAQLMLERGADANARDKDQATPLHLASYMAMPVTVQVLLDHGAEADARNADGQTPLHQVSKKSPNLSHHESRVAQLLLKPERGVDVNARDKDQATPLHLASYNPKPHIVEVLLDHGAEADAQNADGQTPLHQASQGSVAHWYGSAYDGSSCRVAQLLLDRGVDANARTRDQQTPLHLASYQSKLQTVQVLLDYGAEADARNADGQTPLHQVSQSSHHHEYDGLSVARLLLNRDVDVDARDKDQVTPLHLASYHGFAAWFADVAMELLEHGALANAKDIRGQTPLHQAVLGNHNYQSFSSVPVKVPVVRYVQQLLERGADVNAQNKNNETPLHLASRLRLLEMARVLLEKGAQVNVKNSEGKSPLQLASGRKRKAMRRLLSEYSAKQV